MTNRITITSDSVNTMPAIAMTTMLYRGVASVQTNTMPDSTTSVNMSISRLKKRGIAERSDDVLASTSMMSPLSTSPPRLQASETQHAEHGSAHRVQAEAPTQAAHQMRAAPPSANRTPNGKRRPHSFRKRKTKGFYPRIPNSLRNSTRAATIRNPPKMKRSTRSGTYLTNRAPTTAPGMEPIATLRPTT